METASSSKRGKKSKKRKIAFCKKTFSFLRVYELDIVLGGGAVKNVSIEIMYPCISRSEFHDIHAINKHHFFKSMVKFSNFLFLIIYENIRKIKVFFFILTWPRCTSMNNGHSLIIRFIELLFKKSVYNPKNVSYRCRFGILEIENHEVWNTKCVLNK